MTFKEQLEAKDFLVYDDGRCVYEYSDFETLTFTMDNWDCPDGSKAVKLSNLSIVDYINDKVYVTFNYDFYYRTVDELFTLLTVIGYGIR